MLLFLVDLINIEIFRISFSFFYSFSFIFRSRATSVWYQSITSIRDQVIPLLVLIRDQFDPSSANLFAPVHPDTDKEFPDIPVPAAPESFNLFRPTRSIVVSQRDPLSSVDEFGFKD